MLRRHPKCYKLSLGQNKHGYFINAATNLLGICSFGSYWSVAICFFNFFVLCHRKKLTVRVCQAKKEKLIPLKGA